MSKVNKNINWFVCCLIFLSFASYAQDPCIEGVFEIDLSKANISERKLQTKDNVSVRYSFKLELIEGEAYDRQNRGTFSSTLLNPETKLLYSFVDGDGKNITKVGDIFSSDEEKRLIRLGYGKSSNVVGYESSGRTLAIDMGSIWFTSSTIDSIDYFGITNVKIIDQRTCSDEPKRYKLKHCTISHKSKAQAICVISDLQQKPEYADAIIKLTLEELKSIREHAKNSGHSGMTGKSGQ